MCLLFFYSLFLFPIFIHAFYPSFFALIFGPLFPSASSFHLVPPPRLSTSYHHFFYPPHGGTR